MVCSCKRIFGVFGLGPCLGPEGQAFGPENQAPSLEGQVLGGRGGPMPSIVVWLT